MAATQGRVARDRFREKVALNSIPRDQVVEIRQNKFLQNGMSRMREHPAHHRLMSLEWNSTETWLGFWWRAEKSLISTLGNNIRAEPV